MKKIFPVTESAPFAKAIGDVMVSASTSRVVIVMSVKVWCRMEKVTALLLIVRV